MRRAGWPQGRAVKAFTVGRDLHHVDLDRLDEEGHPFQLSEPVCNSTGTVVGIYAPRFKHTWSFLRMYYIFSKPSHC